MTFLFKFSAELVVVIRRNNNGGDEDAAGITCHEIERVDSSKKSKSVFKFFVEISSERERE